VNDEQTPLLCDMLVRNSSLKSLTFRGEELSDHSAPHFERALRLNRSLQSLYFNSAASRLRISIDRWLPLLGALEHNYFVQQLTAPPQYVRGAMAVFGVPAERIVRRNQRRTLVAAALFRWIRLVRRRQPCVERRLVFDLMLRTVSVECHRLLPTQVERLLTYGMTTIIGAHSRDDFVRAVFYGADVDVDVHGSN
jgi:hypothetical protein